MLKMMVEYSDKIFQRETQMWDQRHGNIYPSYLIFFQYEFKEKTTNTQNSGPRCWFYTTIWASSVSYVNTEITLRPAVQISKDYEKDIENWDEVVYLIPFSPFLATKKKSTFLPQPSLLTSLHVDTIFTPPCLTACCVHLCLLRTHQMLCLEGSIFDTLWYNTLYFSASNWIKYPQRLNPRCSSESVLERQASLDS